jgi:hypothetical protein
VQKKQLLIELDILSNGFKAYRLTDTAVNGSSGGSYIYMAFAAITSIVSSNGVPAVAR